jgi:hypothetical protein
MSDEPVDLGDRESVKKRDKEIRVNKATREEMIRAVMGMPQGRALIRWILFDICHIEEPSFTTNGLTMAFREGERNIGQRIKADILMTREDANNYYQMLREHDTYE